MNPLILSQKPSIQNQQPKKTDPAPFRPRRALPLFLAILTFALPLQAQEEMLTGLVKAEFYTGISGNLIHDFTFSENYLNENPDLTLLLPSLETPQSWGDNYGVRVSGWFLPPETGDYAFLMASHHDGEFWLSADETREGLVLLMWDPVKSWTPIRSWAEIIPGRNQDNPENRSDTNIWSGWWPPISLVAGQAYYFEAFMKAGGGRDHLGVTYKLTHEPDPLAGSPTRMTGEVVATLWNPNSVPPVIQTQPLSQTVPFGEPVTLTVELSEHSIEPVSYQWRLDEVDIPDATEASYTIEAFGSEDAGAYSVWVSNAAGEAVSRAATLTLPLEQNLIGLTDGPHTRSHSAHRLDAIRFTAEVTFTALLMHTRLISGEGNMRLGIYADSDGLPGQALGSTAEFPYAPGLNSAPLTEPVNIVSGEVYWLASWQDSGTVREGNEEEGVRRRLRTNYVPEGPFPEADEWEFAVTTYAIYATDELGEPPDLAPASLSGDPTHNNILWTWNPVDGATGYEIELFDGSVEDTGGEPVFGQVFLTPETEYQARVRAYNPFGAGPFSDFVQVQTLEAPAVPVQDFIGMTEGTIGRNQSPPRVDAIQFTAGTSFTAETMHALLADDSGTGNMRMAIYTDDNGNPGLVLGGTAELFFGPGLNSVPLLEPVEILDGNIYWLAAWNDATIRWLTEDGGVRHRGTVDYSSTDPFPDGAGLPFSADVTYAIYATGAPDAPPVGPVLQAGRSNGQIVLDWTDPEFRLQSAEEIDGLWTDVPDASPPFTVDPVESNQFYRLAR